MRGWGWGWGLELRLEHNWYSTVFIMDLTVAPSLVRFTFGAIPGKRLD